MFCKRIRLRFEFMARNSKISVYFIFFIITNRLNKWLKTLVNIFNIILPFLIPTDEIEALVSIESSKWEK